MKYGVKARTRGGARAGAGMKTPDGVEASYKLSISVDEDSYKLIQRYGGGNCSLGVRRICREALETFAEVKSISKPVVAAPTYRYVGKPKL